MESIIFILRILLVVAVSAFIWGVVEPRTQLRRIVRATLLLISLLTILVVLRLTGQ